RRTFGLHLLDIEEAQNGGGRRGIDAAAPRRLGDGDADDLAVGRDRRAAAHARQRTANALCATKFGPCKDRLIHIIPPVTDKVFAADQPRISFPRPALRKTNVIGALADLETALAGVER